MIAAYLRVSSEEQRQDQTIELQRFEIRRFSEARKLQVKYYEDDGVSGMEYLEDRSGGARLLKDLAAGKVERVLIWDLKRLGRDMEILVLALAQIEKHAPVESTTRGVISLKDPGKILITAVECGVASADRAELVFKTKTASRNLAARPEGMWMGGVAPFGYRQVGEDRQARLALSEEPISDTCKLSEAGVVRLIFQKAADGETCCVIAEYLNKVLAVPPAYADPNRDQRRGGRNREKKRRTTKGKWWSSCVRHIIVSRTYRGEHVWGKQESIKEKGKKKRLKATPPERRITRPCPPIVSEDLWERANAALHRNSKPSMGHPKHPYLLKGLIRCQCGRTFIGVTAKQRNGTERAYYRCASKYVDRSVRDTCPRCSAPGLRGPALEASVWDYVAGFLSRPDAAILELKTKIAAEGGPAARVRREIRALEERLRGRDEARMRVLALAGEGIFQGDEIKRELRRIEEGVKEAGSRLAELREISTQAESRILALDWAGRLLSGMRSKLRAGDLTFEEKRYYVQTLVAGITVKPVEGKLPEIEATFRFDSPGDRVRHSVLKHTGPCLP